MGSVVQVHPDPPPTLGGVAQMGEHLLCKQGVIGSIPFTSTINFTKAKGLEGRSKYQIYFWFLTGCNSEHKVFFYVLSIFKNLEEVKFIMYMISHDFMRDYMGDDGLDCIFMSHGNVV